MRFGCVLLCCVLLSVVASARKRSDDLVGILPRTSIYAANEPGSPSLPTDLTTVATDATAALKGSQATSLQWDMPEPSTKQSTSFPLTSLNGGLNVAELEALEAQLQSLQSRVDIVQARAHEMGVSKAWHTAVVGLIIRMPENITTNSAQLTAALATVVSSICDMEPENVRVLSIEARVVTVAVFPSLDFTLETDASAIAHRLEISLMNGVFVRNLIRQGIAIKFNDLEVFGEPQVIKNTRWRFTTEMELRCTSVNLPINKLTSLVPLAIQDLLNVQTEDVVLELDPLTVPGNIVAASLSVFLTNSSLIPQTLEELARVYSRSCQSSVLSDAIQLKLSQLESSIECKPLTVACSEPSPIAQESATGDSGSKGMVIACNGRGVLQSDGTCHCEVGWKDFDCSVRQCVSGFTLQGDSLPYLECSGQGRCLDPWATCECETGFGGHDCSQFLNCTIGSQVQCSNHGSCTPDDQFPHSKFSCKCYDGWVGEQCQVSQTVAECALGLVQIDGNWVYSKCSNRGECDCSGEACVCRCGDLKWGGPACEQKVCGGNCSGNGFCLDGECICNPGWSGSNCNVQGGCSRDCYNRGSCSDGKCTCNAFFTGSFCEVDNCETTGERRIVSVRITTAVAGDKVTWQIDSGQIQSGLTPHSSFQFDICVPSGTHAFTTEFLKPSSLSTSPLDSTVTLFYGHPGSFDLFGASLSDDMYNPSKIDFTAVAGNSYAFTVTKQCPGVPACSAQGNCVKGDCCCDVNWTGRDCSQKLPTLTANPKYVACTSCGVKTSMCDTTGRCVCAREHAIRGLCDVAMCPVANGTCGVCSGHGDCMMGTCVCDVKQTRSSDGMFAYSVEGWTGAACSKQIDCPDGCNEARGLGKCDATVGTCVCNEGRSGRSCAVGTCPGSPACNGNGLCKEDGVCECAMGWTGVGCDQKECVGGCASGMCVDGACKCAPNWFGTHCSYPQTCQSNMIFSNCTVGCVRTCDNPSCISTVRDINECSPGCTCPPALPLWDEKAAKCVAFSECSTGCWRSLLPGDDSVAMSVEPSISFAHGVTRICAHQPVNVCYKAGRNLIDFKADGAYIAHSRKIKAPIGIAVYDEHGQLIPEPWSRAPIEEHGIVVGAFGANEGKSFFAFHQFGRLEVRYFTIGASTSAPVFLGKVPVLVTDCDAKMANSPKLCPLPQVNTTTTKVECSGRATGQTCVFSCNSGYVLDNPARAVSVCEGFGTWDAPVPSCIAVQAAISCVNRENQFCLPPGGREVSGVCVEGQCDDRSAVAFCSRMPKLTGIGCDGCEFDTCDQVNCRASCDTRIPAAVCEPSLSGGWWRNTQVAECHKL
eukprot:c5472_g1_i1.p1 GENE.c5472_g1_i1~~c5472_g1_i1.p1  ORF type:complete len:1350 (+),score=316.05 c5472_g1_i1:73-4050(+)